MHVYVFQWSSKIESENRYEKNVFLIILFASICVGPLQLLNHPNDCDRKKYERNIPRGFLCSALIACTKFNQNMLLPSNGSIDGSPYFTELQCVHIKIKCYIDEKNDEDDDWEKSGELEVEREGEWDDRNNTYTNNIHNYWTYWEWIGEKNA